VNDRRSWRWRCDKRANVTKPRQSCAKEQQHDERHSNRRWCHAESVHTREQPACFTVERLLVSLCVSAALRAFSQATGRVIVSTRSKSNSGGASRRSRRPSGNNGVAESLVNIASTAPKRLRFSPRALPDTCCSVLGLPHEHHCGACQ